jgi:glycogen debranching enzyme
MTGRAAGDEPKPVQGKYFAKKEYQPAPLPKFEETKDKLPSPIFDENPVWIRMYWKSWELAFRNFHEPAANSGYVTQFIDAAFNQNIFQWDTCFMTMFCNYAHPSVPGIGSLDNFYCKQYEDGEIPREIDRTTGVCFAGWLNVEGKPLYSVGGWKGWETNDRNPSVEYRGRKPPEQPSHVTLDAMNHPIFSWAEMEHYRVTGDKERIALVYEPLKRYREALDTYLRQGNGLYMTDWASMDNSQRNPYLDRGGCGVDISSEMSMFDYDLARMAVILGKADEARQFMNVSERTGSLINRLMWDPDKKFYFDLTVEGKRAPVKTVAGFWPLIAMVCDNEQVAALVAQLNNPNTFNRLHRVPTAPADESGYESTGGYWRGAVWAPTDTMVIRGLERYDHHDLAREIAINHLTNMGQVFEKTGTVWENYAPDKAEPGQVDGRQVGRDFVGWTGIGPIMYLLEFGIGLKPVAPRNELRWNLRSAKRVGCERYRFAGHVADLVATPDGNHWRLRVVSDGDFTLRVVAGGQENTLAVKKGENAFEIATVP